MLNLIKNLRGFISVDECEEWNHHYFEEVSRFSNAGMIG